MHSIIRVLLFSAVFINCISDILCYKVSTDISVGGESFRNTIIVVVVVAVIIFFIVVSIFRSFGKCNSIQCWPGSRLPAAGQIGTTQASHISVVSSAVSSLPIYSSACSNNSVVCSGNTIGSHNAFLNNSNIIGSGNNGCIRNNGPFGITGLNVINVGYGSGRNGNAGANVNNSSYGNTSPFGNSRPNVNNVANETSGSDGNNGRFINNGTCRNNFIRAGSTLLCTPPGVIPSTAPSAPYYDECSGFNIPSQIDEPPPYHSLQPPKECAK